MITKEIGGQRLGSENKMNVQMHNYERSTHDLSYIWRSSMAPGTLVPFMSKVALNGDSWKINLRTLIRTLPTVGPLFGAYKVQLDVFECPIRLYQGLLHNNATNIGLKMNQVLLPKWEIVGYTSEKLFDKFGNNIENKSISSTSLARYLGIKSLRQGNTEFDQAGAKGLQKQTYNAIPLLAYWDIYKNYYSNKQEEKGYYITPESTVYSATGVGGTVSINNPNPVDFKKIKSNFLTPQIENFGLRVRAEGSKKICYFYVAMNRNVKTFSLEYVLTKTIGIETRQTIEMRPRKGTADSYITVESIEPSPTAILSMETETSDFFDKNLEVFGWKIITASDTAGLEFKALGFERDEVTIIKETGLKDFNLTNIDDMRRQILAKSNLNERILINENAAEPYRFASDYSVDKIPTAGYPLSGLGVKCFLSDLCNNWVNTEWIDGDNGVNALTAVSTESDSFTIDTLLLHQKMWNVLLRIATSGGTYEDWQEAVYGEEALRRAESPIYLGGLASEITFDEVVSTSATENAAGVKQPLGSLGGRGTQSHLRGSEIEVNVKEPAYIIGIVSITPRLDYSQGNNWDMEELDNLDNLHKPGLDVIGYQNLMQYTLCGWANGSVGKQPAWINYMTSLNECHGDFAEESKAMYMTLNRRYENIYDRTKKEFRISDLTTYINPAKFNYAFADTTIESQNMWVQIGCDIEARRKMSAKQIPNI